MTTRERAAEDRDRARRETAERMGLAQRIAILDALDDGAGRSRAEIVNRLPDFGLEGVAIDSKAITRQLQVLRDLRQVRYDVSSGQWFKVFRRPESPAASVEAPTFLAKDAPADTPPEAPEKPQETREADPLQPDADERGASEAQNGAESQGETGQERARRYSGGVLSYSGPVDPVKLAADPHIADALALLRYGHVEEPPPAALALCIDIRLTGADIADMSPDYLARCIEASTTLLGLAARLQMKRGES